MSTLPALLDELAARHGHREALVSARGRLTFAELAVSANHVARALAAHGVDQGARVGLLLPNWPEWLAMAFGIWQQGAVLVPLNTLYRPRELAYALRHADVSLLIAVRGFLRHDYVAAVQEIPHADLPALQEIVWLARPTSSVAPVDLSPLLAAGAVVGDEKPRPHVTEASAAEPATVFFTSGTTADPKGVVHAHRALVCAAHDIGRTLGLGPEDRTWGCLPFFFTGGLVAVALATLAAGGTVILQEVFEPGETLGLLARERCTVFFAWPHQAEALIGHPNFDRAKLTLCKGVGANTKWAAQIYPADHHAVGTYGMTETAPLATAWPWHAPLGLRAASHGPPVGDKQVRIVHPDTAAVLPAGAEGEICVRGATLFSHYYRQARAECFDAEGFFHTGDLGRLDADGALHFLGRIKDVIKTAGVNVAAAEIEAVLHEHAAVAAAHVVGVPHAARGENVAAFVVPKGVVSQAQLIAHCRVRLASYKVPRHLWFRREDELPQKGSGKIDKARLRAEAVRLVGAAELEP